MPRNPHTPLLMLNSTFPLATLVSLGNIISPPDTFSTLRATSTPLPPMCRRLSISIVSLLESAMFSSLKMPVIFTRVLKSSLKSVCVTFDIPEKSSMTFPLTHLHPLVTLSISLMLPQLVSSIQIAYQSNSIDNANTIIYYYTWRTTVYQ